MFRPPHISVILFLAFAGCTQPPEIPERARGPEQPVQRVILDDRLTAKDVKELFRAVNVDGDFDAIKPWIEGPSDAELEPLVGVVAKYIYAEAQLPWGALGRLSARADSRFFSKLAVDVAKWKAEPTAGSEARLVLRVAQTPIFPRLAGRAVPFLSDDFTDSFSTFAYAKGQAPPLPDLKSSDIFAEAAALLKTSNAEATAKLIRAVRDGELIRGAIGASSGLYRNWNGEAPKQIQAALEKVIPPNAVAGNHGEKLLAFVTAAAPPSGKLFKNLEEGLRLRSEGFKARTEIFSNLIASTVTGFVRETISERVPPLKWNRLRANVEQKETDPTPEFREMFQAARSGIEFFSGEIVAKGTHTDHLLIDLPIYLHALAITRWFRDSAPENLERLENATGESIWDVPWKAKAIPVVVKVADGTGFKLDPEAERQLAEDASDDFLVELRKLVSVGGVGGLNYNFPAYDGTKTLREVFADVVSYCHTKRRFADPEPVVRGLVYLLTRKTSGIGISDFETSSLLDSLNRQIVAYDLTLLRKFKRILFEDANIDDLSPGIRAQLREWVGNEDDLDKRLDALFDNIGALASLDSDESTASPLEAYQLLLRNMRVNGFPDLKTALVFAADGGIFSTATDGKWRYPTILRLAREGGVAHVLSLLSRFQPWEMRAFSSPWEQLLEEKKNFDPVPGITGLLRDSLQDSPATFAAIWERRGALKSLRLTAEERAWLSRFLASPDFAIAWNFFTTHGSLSEASQMAESLLDLEKQGKIGRAAELLEYARDERIQEIARVLKEMQKSGEFKGLVLALREFFAVAAVGRLVAK